MARMWVHFIVFLVLSTTASSLQCPDGQKCEGSSICCKLPEGDKYTCCSQPQFTGASLRMLPPESRNEVSGVVCPDASTCPVAHSCQLSLNSTFACCPWEEAISCVDGCHCCPLGTHCSTDGRVCIENEDSTSAVIVRAVQCPDSEWECPDGSTCCLMADESWGCCPMPEASCCSDKIHCCPHDTTCDLVEARCLETFGEQPLSKKFPAKKRTPVLNAATCCLLPTGQYGCCALQNAVCCSDHLHCCPQDTHCDLKHSICTMTPKGSWPITHLNAGLQTAHDIQCDSEFSCPDGYTCCRTTSGSWGCCPMEEAVCCSDQIHCCPKGYQCVLSEGSCQKDGQSISLVLKIDTSSTTASRIDSSSTASSIGRMVQCDPYTACHDGQTCCRLVTGAWGCCLLTQATCCQDQIHCCPSGHKCDSSSGTCLKDGYRVPWVEKTTAIVGNLPSSRDVKCDDQFSCADGQTCCMRSGAWACCPLFQAVCCEDQAHCCPHGYICDVKHSLCIKSGGLSQGISMTPILARQETAIKCDNFSSCKDKETCCKMASGNWGHCPFPKAVCCEDHQHCCPFGYTCNVTAQTCEKQHWPGLADAAVDLLTSSQNAVSSQDVLCGEQHYCHTGQTCCKARSSGWACCPYEKGTCCYDRRHCCPSGYYCSLLKHRCYRRKPLRWDTGNVSPHSIDAHVLL
uniref:Granulin n=1 Tax=Naja naja TaxID=35670 RepID=A0A8C7E1P3_NAJNA